MISGLCGIILAAGESSRMGRDKALLPWPKQKVTAKGGPAGTLLSVGIRALSDYCDVVLVVTGKNELSLSPIIFAAGASQVRNLEPERGQFSSLQTGLREVLNRGRDNAMVTLVDRPPPQPETLGALIEAFARRDHNTWAVVPEHNGNHGHPILIGREMIELFLTAPANATAREIEHANQTRIRYLATDDAAVITNVDTPEDYASLQ